MSCEAKDELNLSNLPSDIVRKIIKIELDSIHIFRQISQRWNTIAKSIMAERMSYPPIKLYEYSIDDDCICDVKALVASHYATYFGLNEWGMWGKIDSNQIQEFKMQFRNVSEWFKKSHIKLFTRASHVEKLDILYLGVVHFRHLRPLLRDIIISEVEFFHIEEFSNVHQSLLGYLYRTNSTQKVVLNFCCWASSAWKKNKPALAKFLSLAAGKLSSIIIIFYFHPSERAMNAEFPAERKIWWQSKVDDLAEETKLTINFDFIPDSSYSIFSLFALISMSSNVLNLADLPSDIMRNIIDSNVESIDDMRLISNRWNSFLKDRRNLPPIKLFYLYHSNDGGFVPMISIASRYATYFGVDEWSKSTTGKVAKIQEFSKHFEITEKYAELKKFLYKLFARSSRVNIFKFLNSEVEYSLLIKPILRDICIRELEIGGLKGFSKNEEYFLTKFIRENSVQKLTLNFLSPASTNWSDSKPGLAKFLPLAARELSSIDLIFGWSEVERLRNAEFVEHRRDMWKDRVRELAEETQLPINSDVSEYALRINIEK